VQILDRAFHLMGISAAILALNDYRLAPVGFLINPCAHNASPNNFCRHDFIKQLVNIKKKMLEDAKAFY